MSLLYTERVLSSSPISYNRLGDESGLIATDEIGSADGTYSSSSILGGAPLVTDETDGAANINGATYVKFGSNIRDLLVGKQVVTVELLIKPNSLHSSEVIVSLPRYANNTAPFICSDPSTRDEVSCLAPGVCSNPAYTDENSCETAVETWTSAVCSDPAYTDQSSCEAAGTCSDPIHTDQVACEGAGETWTPETWTPGSCSDPAFSDQTSCESAVHIWDHDNTWAPWPDWLGYHSFFQLYSNNGKIALSASTSLYDGWFAESASAVLTPGVTSHVIAEVNFSTGRIEIYVNDSLVASANGSPESSSVTFDNSDIAAGYEDMLGSTPRVSDTAYGISATIDELSFYDKALSTSERSTHFYEAGASVPATLNTFVLSYNSVASNQTWISLITVELQTEMTFPEHKFNLEYDIEVFGDDDKVFGFKYVDDNSIANHYFRLYYKDPKDKVERKYTFRLPSTNETTLDAQLVFLLPYINKSLIADISDYRFNLLYESNMVIYPDIKFKIPFHHDESIDRNLEFTIPYYMRTVNAGSTSPDDSIIIPQGNNIYDYSITLPGIRATTGDHIAVLDSGSTYSAFFAKFTIEYPETFPFDSILYDKYGVTITLKWEGLDVQTLEIYMTNVDIDSSISVSAYRLDDGEYIAMLKLYPNWSSFINTVSYEDDGQLSPVTKDYSYLVELDSGQFKILPLQPESCCILRTKDLCMLPQHQRLNEALPDAPKDEEPPIVGIPVNEMLLMIEEPRSSYIYGDSFRSVITSTHNLTSWDDITGMGEGQALEPGENPFIDINPTAGAIPESLFQNNQAYQFSGYPINPLPELAIISSFEEARDNWNEGSLSVDFEFNPPIRPRSSEMITYEDHIHIEGGFDTENETLLYQASEIRTIRSLALPNNKIIIVYRAYGNENLFKFNILDEFGTILATDTIDTITTPTSGTTSDHAIPILLGNGNILIAYNADEVTAFKIYDQTGLLVVDKIVASVSTSAYVGATTLSDGTAMIVSREWIVDSDYEMAIYTFGVDGTPINTLRNTNSDTRMFSSPALIDNRDNQVYIFYTGNSNYGWIIKYNVLTNSWVSATPERFTTYNFVNPRGAIIDNGDIVVVHYRANYGDVYYARFNNDGSLYNIYSLSSNANPQPDIKAITEGIYKGGYYISYNYSSTVYFRRYDEDHIYQEYERPYMNSNYSMYLTFDFINNNGDFLAIYNDYDNRTDTYYMKYIEDTVNIVDREMRRSSDAIIDRKQGYTLSMVDGFIFSTQLIRIERDISYLEGGPTLPLPLPSVEHLFTGQSQLLPNEVELGVGTNNIPIDIGASVVSTGETRPSSIDSDMIEYIPFITPPIVANGGFAVVDTTNYGQLYRMHEIPGQTITYDVSILEKIYTNPEATSYQESVNPILRVRNTDILLGAPYGGQPEYYPYVGLYVSLDGGTNWELSGPPPDYGFNNKDAAGFAAYNGSNIYMYYDSYNQRSFITTDLTSNPKRWTELPQHDTDSGRGRGFTYNIDSGTWYKAGSHELYYSQDIGQTWIAILGISDGNGVPSGFYFWGVSGIEVDSQGNTWIAGFMTENATNDDYILMIKLTVADPITPITTWSYNCSTLGENYRDYGMIIDSSDNIYYYNWNNITNKNVVLKSTDGGSTFIENDLTYSYNEASEGFGMYTENPYFYMYVNDIFYLVFPGFNDNSVYKSNDGIHWDFIIDSNGSSSDILAIHPIII